jgi:hypothetical protein
MPNNDLTAGCGCACTAGGFCGGCGHAGCGGRRAAMPPAPTGLPRLGVALPTTKEILDWLSEQARRDPWVAHAFVDGVLLAALRSIRDGNEDPGGLARAVLSVAHANFPRGTA